MIAILAAAQFVTFGALFLWVPTRAALPAVPRVRRLRAGDRPVRVGPDPRRGPHGRPARERHRGRVPAAARRASSSWCRTTSPPPGTRRRARRRPVLTSASIVAACAALATVALLDNERGVGTLQSTLMILLLGGGMAARVLANQMASTQANKDTQEALARREAALQEADLALERVREANETLRRSEEHLRLVFDAAVDGFVELDERDVIVPGQRSVRAHGGDRPRDDRGPALVGARGLRRRRRRVVRPAARLRPRTDQAARGAAAVPGVADLARARPIRRGACCWRATSRRRRSPTRRSARSSSSCRTATRTARGSLAGRTRRSSRSGTGSRATCTTGRSRASRPRRSRSRPRC